MEDYLIICEFNPGELAKKVNENIMLGYKLVGQPFCKPYDNYSSVKFCQALIYVKQ